MIFHLTTPLHLRRQGGTRPTVGTTTHMGGTTLPMVAPQIAVATPPTVAPQTAVVTPRMVVTLRMAGTHRMVEAPLMEGTLRTVEAEVTPHMVAVPPTGDRPTEDAIPTEVVLKVVGPILVLSEVSEDQVAMEALWTAS